MKMAAVLAALLAAGLTGCATPHVVEVEKPGDRALSCAQLADEVAEADRFEQEARKDRGVTGTNVAAAILFWPALAGTYVNTEDAINAAKERRDHINTIRHEKGCP